ncbi:MAG: hypothetical protein CMJ46_05170 [Planctomyces sp.]|nr:hypothetical protein [Planctomyces sp.]
MKSSLSKLKHRPLLRNFLLCGFVAVTLFIGSVICWRHNRVSSIPDVGEPFDVAAYLAKFDIEVNAFDVLGEASKMLIEIEKKPKYRNFSSSWIFPVKLTTLQREYLAETDPALDKWLSASDIPAGYEVHPRDVNVYSTLEISQNSRAMTGRILTRVRQKLNEGDTEAATELLQQLLNLNLLFRNQSLITRLCGIATYNMYTSELPYLLQFEQWTVEDLRTLQQITQQHRVADPPISESIKFEYFIARHALDDKLKNRSIATTISREDEVARRVLNLIFDNWLTHCDLPTAERPPCISHTCNSYSLSAWFEPDTSAMQCQVQFFTGENADLLLDSYHRLGSTHGLFNGALGSPKNIAAIVEDRDNSRQELALTLIALAIYFRELGQFPESLEQLVPEYLDAVPINRDVQAGKPEQVGTPIDYKVEEGNALLMPVEPTLQFTIYPPGGFPRYTE